MCSILGYFNSPLNHDEIVQLNQLMVHRGPDNSDLRRWSMRNKALFLGHNRLAIQDLSDVANQPMENERFVLVFNGEIYNHFELRKKLNFIEFHSRSDTETILQLCSIFGIKETVKQLNGMFAIGLFDKIEQTITLVRDRVGIKPLYYSFQNEEFAFASEIKGLSAHLKSEVNNMALIHAVSFGYITEKMSYYKSIKKLEGGSILIFNGSHIYIEKYWNLPENKIYITFEEAVEEIHNLLQSAVKYQLISDIEVGSFLSGGVDSSLVTAIMAHQTGRKIKTFSIGFENSRYDEIPFAKLVSNYLGTEHHEHIFTCKKLIKLLDKFNNYFDEPFGDSSALPTIMLCQITKKNVTVVLSGDGGDEVFFGYDRYFFVERFKKLFNIVPNWLRKIISNFFEISNIDKLEKLSFPLKQPSMEVLYSVMTTAVKPWELTKVFNREFVEECLGTTQAGLLGLMSWKSKPFDTIEELSRLDFYRYLPDDILTKVDRASMQHSLEVRVPILDHRLIEYMYRLNEKVKFKREQKSILKQILYKYIPQYLVDRPKQGFSVPLKEWFRKDLKEILLDRLNSLDDRFNKSEILRMANLHFYHNRNYAPLFWNILRINA